MTTNNSEMSLIDHIEELRKRLLLMLAAIGVGVIVSLIFGDKFVTLLTVPIGGVSKLQSIEITENIGVYMKVSLLGGVILAFPVVLYELLMFILPGLTKSERSYVLWSIPLATFFFLGGVAFSYFVMLPSALPFLTNFLGVQTNPRLSSYISFVTNLLFWVGVCFELPLFIYILARFGVVTASGLLHYWRQAIVIIAILAAVITPTVDPVNMSLMMAPLIVLYFISILFAWFARRGRSIKTAETSEE